MTVVAVIYAVKANSMAVVVEATAEFVDTVSYSLNILCACAMGDGATGQGPQGMCDVSRTEGKVLKAARRSFQNKSTSFSHLFASFANN